MSTIKLSFNAARSKALLLSVLMLAMMYGIIFVVSNIEINYKKTQVIRKVEQVIAPQLPPPQEEPKPVKDYENPVPSINLIGLTGGPNIKFKAKPKITNIELKELPKPKINIDFGDFGDSLNSDIPTYEVSQLDEVPKIVKTRKSRIPRELRKQGVKTVKTKIKIIIDQTGRASINSILDAGYTEMLPIIRQHINEIRFTPPTREGKKVQAHYLFKLNFREVL